jgi:hypothetical protein
VDEAACAERDAHVADFAPSDRKEHQVARLEVGSIDWRSCLPLVAHASRQRDPGLRKDVLHEPAAVEAVGIGTAASVRRAEERLRYLDRQFASWHGTRIS